MSCFIRIGNQLINPKNINTVTVSKDETFTVNVCTKDQTCTKYTADAKKYINQSDFEEKIYNEFNKCKTIHVNNYVNY